MDESRSVDGGSDGGVSGRGLRGFPLRASSCRIDSASVPAQSIGTSPIICARSRSGREAYERDPRALYRTIMDEDSPFRHYRESYIGAFEEGQDVPLARDIDRAARL